MVEVVAERGYELTRVRDVVGAAGVSTRAFYELFQSKDDCFVQTCALISDRSSRRLVEAAEATEDGWREQARLAIDEFVDQLDRNPAGARLILVEACADGNVASDRARRSVRELEGELAECLARSADPIVLPPLLVEGVVAGISAVARSRLLNGDEAGLGGRRGELHDWATCIPHEAAVDLAELDRETARSVVGSASTVEVPIAGESDLAPSAGDRALILEAVVELAMAHGYAALTADRIRAAAGVSRRKFRGLFDDAESCYMAAFELRAGKALVDANRAKSEASSRPGGVYRAIEALCEHVMADAFLAEMCLGREFPTGPVALRSRRRLAEAIVELLAADSSRAGSPTSVVLEASRGAVWTLFRRHVVEKEDPRAGIAATLAYMALTPAVGAAEAVAAIRAEQEF